MKKEEYRREILIW